MPAGTVKPITEEERKEIQNAYRQLLRLLHGKMKGNDQEQIRKAFELAAKAHEKQRRKAGEPYIMHPIEVARICIEEIGLGPTAAVCALRAPPRRYGPPPRAAFASADRPFASDASAGRDH